jgi:oligoendopeptidase F
MMPAMRCLTPALLLVLLGAAAAPPQIDLTHYFASPAAESKSRQQLLTDIRAFERTSAASIHGAAQLASWLATYDALLERIERHDIYVYLRSEEDVDDVADGQADEALGAIEDELSVHLRDVLRGAGSMRLSALLRTDAPLQRYRYLIESTLADTHTLSPAQTRAVALTADPVIASMSAAYKALARSDDAPHEDAYAAMLIAIANARNGVARLRGYQSAVEATYADRALSPASVERVLDAVRSSDALTRYHAARDSGAAAPAATYSPAPMSVDDAVPLVLAAEEPMGPVYASAYRALLDPRNGRFELCTAPACDTTGFSAGFAGLTSGLFVGKFDGSVHAVKVIAHEAGHAVHREFMAQHQPVAAYNEGPHWMFESFAIFNELLFYDHLYRIATNDPQRAYYLNAFLADATFQVFGSAQETDLEARIYRGVRAGTIRTAGDLDALTMRVFERYDASIAAKPATGSYWARDELYFTDPLYDVNYLYAGLLALRYFDLYEHDAPAFSKRYVALLENGFDAPSPDLLRRFLGIDLGDEAGLVREASALIDARSAQLEKLYRSSAR